MRYNQLFGVETAVESLHEVAGYQQDAIWLFSVELFYKEMAKFNLKLAAQAAEMEKAYKNMD